MLCNLKYYRNPRSTEISYIFPYHLHFVQSCTPRFLTNCIKIRSPVITVQRIVTDRISLCRTRFCLRIFRGLGSGGG